MFRRVLESTEVTAKLKAVGFVVSSTPRTESERKIDDSDKEEKKVPRSEKKL